MLNPGDIAHLVASQQKGPPTIVFTGQRVSVALSDTTVPCDRWNAVAVHVFGPAGQTISLTVNEAVFPSGQYLPVADPNGTQIGLQTGASFVCLVGLSNVKLGLTVLGASAAPAPGWTVYVQPLLASPISGGALYPSGTTGPIASNNAATTLTVQLGSLQSVESNQIFDAKQVLLAVANVGTGQAITGLTLKFTDTTPGGASLTIPYAVPVLDIGTIASGTQAYFEIPLRNQVLKTISVDVTFAAAPAAGQADIQAYIQGAAGLATDPTSGLDLHSAVINVSASGANTIIAQNVGESEIIYVTSYVLIAYGTVNVTWMGAGGGAALSGPMPLVVNSGLSMATTPPASVLGTAAGQALVLSLSAAVQVSGHLTYFKRLP